MIMHTLAAPSLIIIYYLSLNQGNLLIEKGPCGEYSALIRSYLDHTLP